MEGGNRQEDDIQLVDNAAAASLFSPNMWVQRPMARARGVDRPPASAFKAARDNDENWDRHQADDELEYLQPEEEQQNEAAMEDLETIAAHQHLLWQWEEEGVRLDARMKALVEEADHLHRESHSIRHLFKLFNVMRDDFSAFHPECNAAAIPDQQRKLQLIETGERILRTLDGGGEPAEAQATSYTQQRKRRRAAEANTLIYEAKDEEDPGAAAAAAMDPPVRTPAEAVFRDPGVVAMTPREHPEEAVVAAAAMTLKQGDAASAMLFLLQQAYASHLENVAARRAAVKLGASQPANA